MITKCIHPKVTIRLTQSTSAPATLMSGINAPFSEQKKRLKGVLPNDLWSVVVNDGVALRDPGLQHLADCAVIGSKLVCSMGKQPMVSSLTISRAQFADCPTSQRPSRKRRNVSQAFRARMGPLPYPTDLDKLHRTFRQGCHADRRPEHSITVSAAAAQ
jgi:hypothetical protein